MSYSDPVNSTDVLKAVQLVDDNLNHKQPHSLWLLCSFHPKVNASFDKSVLLFFASNIKHCSLFLLIGCGMTNSRLYLATVLSVMKAGI